METVTGTNGNDPLLLGLSGTDTKIEGKLGDDKLRGSTGDDLLLGHQGSDVHFGSLGRDAFEFTKFAFAGDADYVGDFQVGRDVLIFGPGVTITAAKIVDAGTSFNGVGLANDAKVLDLELTLHIVDAEKIFDQTVTLVDSLKNTDWHVDQVEAYLSSFGTPVEITTDAIA